MRYIYFEKYISLFALVSINLSMFFLSIALGDTFFISLIVAILLIVNPISIKAYLLHKKSDSKEHVSMRIAFCISILIKVAALAVIILTSRWRITQGWDLVAYMFSSIFFAIFFIFALILALIGTFIYKKVKKSQIDMSALFISGISVVFVLWTLIATIFYGAVIIGMIVRAFSS